jgi:hypothetical protein
VTADDEFRWCQDAGASVARGGLLLLAAALLLTAGTCAALPRAWACGQPLPFGLTLPSPSLEDLNRFPSRQEADGQVKLCQQHLEYLTDLRAYHPAGNDCWRTAVAETRDRLAYWRLLEKAADPFLLDDVRLAELASLSRAVGPRRYWRGWHPPLLPGVPPELPARKAGNNADPQ